MCGCTSALRYDMAMRALLLTLLSLPAFAQPHLLLNRNDLDRIRILIPVGGTAT